MKLPIPNTPTPIVAIIGGAVAGSEAAVLCAERGAIAVVFDQKKRPYGKIEDGLPRWHEKLREQEYRRIDINLSHERVIFVPNTSIGQDTSLDQLKSLGFSAIILANGAWKDRALPVNMVDQFIHQGLVYQNSFVHWFNHYHQPDYQGPKYQVTPDAIVIGGGLASIDVAKIINLELFAKAFSEKGIVIDVIELESMGIDQMLKRHQISQKELGIKGVTLYYRRRKQDMPLAQITDTSPEHIAKIHHARLKAIERVERKYLVRFENLVSPTGFIENQGRLIGMKFIRNTYFNESIQPIVGSDFEVSTSMVISSIGSVPIPINGIPMKGELYDYEDPITGRIRGVPKLFGLGNVLTGRGNIRDSRENASYVTEHIIANYLGIAEQPRTDTIEYLPKKDFSSVISAALTEGSASIEQIQKIYQFIEQVLAQPT